MMQRRIVILEAVAGPLYLVILAASLWVLLRGHNEPGGGFIGGLVAVSASILWAVAFGSVAATRRMPLRDPVTLAATGVLLAGLSGLPALFDGDAFLTHWWGELAGVKVSTVLLFDIGVYLCVWGALAGYALALLSIDEADVRQAAAQDEGDARPAASTDAAAAPQAASTPARRPAPGAPR
jgi:multicomponent Na+:H+ antiporter subunit B